MKNKTFAYIVLVIVIVLILDLTLLSFLRAYQHYSLWKGQNFNQSGKIESWMSLKMISDRFSLNPGQIDSVLGNKTKINPHQSLDLFCRQSKQNCTEITNQLNVLAGK